MSTVRLDNVAKRFGATTVVAGVSLEVANGELIALLGPSGSGKTTLLRMIAGFESVDAGRIILDGDDVTSRTALERRCGMVFQHYALFPHLTVGENVAYGLASERMPREARDARTAEVLAMVDLSGFESRNIASLSGGQQQRVALARALAPRPRVLLLDEPLSNLDPSLRERTRKELGDLVRRTGITTILVTHEQEEAFDLADRIALLHRGVLEQLGRPEDLYQQPATPFVAQFVGRTSELAGTVVGADGDIVRVTAGGGEWRATAAPGTAGAVRLLVRPEAVELAPSGTLAGTVARRRFAGANAVLTVRLASGEEIEVAARPDAAAEGDAVRLQPTGIGAHAWGASA
ncbi:MAG TPA: ABC transporter ATP-binding protein [Gemmatimonadales bacterium]|jgi:putative spermidine/putrescine transport system ATP-binding protein